jgi:uncharacterized RDD family membrane protein YckC
MMYESLLLLGVLSVAFLVPHLIGGLVWGKSAPGALAWLHIYVVLGGYFIWCWCRSGQTLAMQTWRLKLENARPGERLSWRQAVLRYTLCWFSLAFVGLGLWWALIDRDRQFLHDRLAGTRLVLLPRQPAG